MPTLPKMVNRGGAGLLNKRTTGDGDSATPMGGPDLWARTPKNHIHDGLASSVVDIASLVPDPLNARIHPERNMAAIKDSLCSYKQVKPVVVRADKRIVVAGNGTLEAAKQLGWTKIAATVVDMDDVQAAGYGLADNRSAELAKWDFEIVARLDRLLLEAGQVSVGWSLDELEVLRAADWTPKESDGGEHSASSPKQHVLTLTPEQYAPVSAAIAAVRAAMLGADIDDAECVSLACAAWNSSREPE